jgi:hypothetical protein
LDQSAILTAPGETGNHEGTRAQAREIMRILETGTADRAHIEQVFAHLNQAAQGV